MMSQIKDLPSDFIALTIMDELAQAIKSPIESEICCLKFTTSLIGEMNGIARNIFLDILCQYVAVEMDAADIESNPCSLIPALRVIALLESRRDPR